MYSQLWFSRGRSFEWTNFILDVRLVSTFLPNSTYIKYYDNPIFSNLSYLQVIRPIFTQSKLFLSELLTSRSLGLDFLSITASFYSISHRQFWNLHLREHPRANITDQSHSVSKLLDPRSLVVFPSIDLRSRIDNSRTVYPFRLRPSPFHDRIESLEGPSISATIDPSRSRYSSRTVYTAFL